MEEPLAQTPRSRLRLKYTTMQFDAQGGGSGSGRAGGVEIGPGGQGLRENRVAAAWGFTMASKHQAVNDPLPINMTLRLFRISAAIVFGTVLLVGTTLAQTQAN